MPSKGYCLLAGGSPAMAKTGSHVAWMAGGNGNIVTGVSGVWILWKV